MYVPVRACVRVCESAYRFIRGDVEIVEGRRYGDDHSDLHVCVCVFV